MESAERRAHRDSTKKREEEKEGGERKGRGRVAKLLLRGLGDAGGDRIEGAKLVDAVPLFLEGG